MRSSPVYIIGTGLSHDGSVCLMADGKVVLAIEKERITRRKHDGGNDRLAMQYVLDRAGITLADVSLIVQNENFGMFHCGNLEYRGEPRLPVDETRVVTISHHLAHAYSAFGPSGFDEASVLVVDGCGNAFEDCIDVAPGTVVGEVPPGHEHVYFEKDSYYTGQGGRLRTVAKDFSPWAAFGRPASLPATMHSIGGAYQAFSQYVFGEFSDTGKLMGLAPYGKPGRFSMPLFELSGGRILVCRETVESFTQPARSRAALKAAWEYYADVAHWVQSEIERALLYLVRDRFDRCPSRNLAYAGGVALNAVANTRILRECGFERIFIQPAAGDNGLAVGGAYYGWLEVLKRERVCGSGSTYLGATYPVSRVRDAVKAAGESVAIEGEADVGKSAARMLADGKVVGWYRGGAEFGPRALGHRSVLAHPGIARLRDHINTHIKFREDFRPFAPSVLAHAAARCFDCEEYDSPYMILVFDVRPEWRDRLINVVHADGSSRLHTVTKDSDPVYFGLLEEFERLTGLPVLLNTSLNKRGMPIVETPEEALALFTESALDALVLDDVVVTKQVQPTPAADRIRGLIEQPAEHHVPLIGMRVASLAVDYKLHHSPASGLDGSSAQVTLRFTDTPDTLVLPSSADQFLRLCDGVRSYADIASEMGVAPSVLLRETNRLTRRGILDHAALPDAVACDQPSAIAR